jgi:CarD family transcriptional regulator
MFEIGDAVVHPVRGAGKVTGMTELQADGDKNLYYTIALLDQPDSSLMIPVASAQGAGLRPPISQNKLKRVMRVLRQDPETLPADRKERQDVLAEKLNTGDVLQLAELVRDMFWKSEQESDFTTRGKRLYTRAMILLSGEIAVAQDINLEEAEDRVRATLSKSVASAS